MTTRPTLMLIRVLVFIFSTAVGAVLLTLALTQYGSQTLSSGEQSFWKSFLSNLGLLVGAIGLIVGLLGVLITTIVRGEWRRYV